MFLVLWEFEVKPGCEDRFESIYSPGGNWDTLFRRDANHLETRLFRDISRPRIHITIDSWKSREAYDDFLAARGAEYREIDAACEGLTSKERHLGSFEPPAP
jgi:quinol monooxygenase YgiN